MQQQQQLLQQRKCQQESARRCYQQQWSMWIASIQRSCGWVESVTVCGSSKDLHRPVGNPGTKQSWNFSSLVQPTSTRNSQAKHSGNKYRRTNRSFPFSTIMNNWSIKYAFLTTINHDVFEARNPTMTARLSLKGACFVNRWSQWPEHQIWPWLALRNIPSAKDHHVGKDDCFGVEIVARPSFVAQRKSKVSKIMLAIGPKVFLDEHLNENPCGLITVTEICSSLTMFITGYSNSDC